jgi:hypothetical protein
MEVRRWSYDPHVARPGGTSRRAMTLGSVQTIKGSTRFPHELTEKSERSAFALTREVAPARDDLCSSRLTPSRCQSSSQGSGSLTPGGKAPPSPYLPFLGRLVCRFRSPPSRRRSSPAHRRLKTRASLSGPLNADSPRLTFSRSAASSCSLDCGARGRAFKSLRGRLRIPHPQIRG